MDSLLRTDKEIECAYWQYADSLYRLSYLMLRNEAEAEDAVQETFIRLMACGNPPERGEHEKAWLIVTASNYCRDVLRKKKRASAFVDREKQNLRQEAVSSPEDDTLALVLSLPEKYKLPLYLYYYERYTVREISQIVHKKEGTVRSLLSRGRNKLRLEMEGDAT